MQHHYNGLAEYVNVHTTALSDIVVRDHHYITKSVLKRKQRNDETHRLIDMGKLPSSLQTMAGFINA